MKTRNVISLAVISLALFLILVLKARADHFELVGSIPSTHGLSYWTMAYRSGYLAMGDGRSPGTGIEIIDVRDPAQMTLAGYRHTGHMTYWLEWSGDYVYSPASWDGFYIYNVSDFQNITMASHILYWHPIGGVAVKDSTALVGEDLNGTGGALYCVAVDDPYRPRIVYSSDTLSCGEIILRDTIAYSYAWCNEVLVLDAAEPRNPKLISRFSCPSVNAIDVDQSRNLMYLTGFDFGLKIYDITDPYSPSFMSDTTMPNGAWCIDVCHSKVHHEIVFISGYTGGLWAVDVSDPWHPQPTTCYFSSLWSCCVISHGDIIFNTIADSMLALRYVRNDAVDDEGDALPARLALSQNYPNPFNYATAITYTLPDSRDVRLEIYDVIGRKVSTLVDGFQPAGNKTISWDACGYPSGTYIYRLTAGDRVFTNRMTLLK